MFRWYKQAAACYTYLADVTHTPDEENTMESFSKSRWFTRGWTRQELLAPKEVVFYADEWKRLGTKSELVDRLSSITRIDKAYLLGKDINQASIAQRMSWAARRKTSRVEDIAYCLVSTRMQAPRMVAPGFFPPSLTQTRSSGSLMSTLPRCMAKGAKHSKDYKRKY